MLSRSLGAPRAFGSFLSVMRSSDIHERQARPVRTIEPTRLVGGRAFRHLHDLENRQTMSEPDQFDFSGLGFLAPSGLSILHALDYLMVCQKKRARTLYFIIYKKGGRFYLHARSRHIGQFSRDHCSAENLVASNDELQPILEKLGWGKPAKEKPAGRFQ